MEFRVLLAPVGVYPGQVEPGDEVPIVGVGKEVRVIPGLLANFQQLAVSGDGLDDAVPVHVEEEREEEGFFLARPLLLSAEGEALVGGLAAGVFQELGCQCGDHVERGVHAGELPQHFCHVQVVPDAMQPHPGQGVTSCEEVFVGGLVHVPDEGDIEGLGHGSSALCWRYWRTPCDAGRGRSCLRPAWAHSGPNGPGLPLRTSQPRWGRTLCAPTPRDRGGAGAGTG